MYFYGGTVFGKAVNNPSVLNSIIIGIMISCQYGGPTFVSKMSPVANLTAEFLRVEILKTTESITSAGAQTKVLVCDNNRVNQNFFRDFPKVPKKPWLTKDGVFLLFDFVHLIKSLRNNWITEKTKELIFYDESGNQKTAKWAHLEALYDAESSGINYQKLARWLIILIEKQKVSTIMYI